MDGVFIVTQISECTISSGVCAPYDFPTRTLSLCFLPKMQPSQTYLVCWSMVIPSPYSLCAVASAHQNSDVQIWNATTRIHRELLFEMQLENQRYHFLSCRSACLLPFFLSWMRFMYLSFLSWLELSSRKTSDCLSLALSLSAGCLDACL